MSRRTAVIVIIGLVALVPLGGCGRQLPPIVPVQGTVLINGQPLPKASVTFVPQLDNVGAEAYSSAVTDENGKFTLTSAANGQPGAFVGKHIVLIAEPPLPNEMRRTRDTQAVYDYRASLGNRPIPPQYASVSQSPIRIEIKEGQEPVKIELTR